MANEDKDSALAEHLPGLLVLSNPLYCHGGPYGFDQYSAATATAAEPTLCPCNVGDIASVRSVAPR